MSRSLASTGPGSHALSSRCLATWKASPPGMCRACRWVTACRTICRTAVGTAATRFVTSVGVGGFRRLLFAGGELACLLEDPAGRHPAKNADQQTHGVVQHHAML